MLGKGTMKKSLLLLGFIVLVLAFVAQPGFAGGKVKFGGDLDRPVSTKEADTKEAPDSKDEPPVPEEPEDEEEEEPPEFMDEELEGNSFVLVLDRSGSMSSSFSGGFPVMDRNGNVVSYPNRWQATQSETANCVNAMTDEDTFDLVTYATSIYICFSMLKEANNGNKASAIGWIYNQGTTGCTNSYDALKAAYNNYGQVDTIMFMSDGYPNTALSLGCGGCACSGWIANRIVTDTRAWMIRQIAMYAGHKLMVIQIGGSPYAFMTQLGALPGAEFSLK